MFEPVEPVVIAHVCGFWIILLEVLDEVLAVHDAVNVSFALEALHASVEVTKDIWSVTTHQRPNTITDDTARVKDAEVSCICGEESPTGAITQDTPGDMIVLVNLKHATANIVFDDAAEARFRPAAPAIVICVDIYESCDGFLLAVIPFSGPCNILVYATDRSMRSPVTL